MSRIIYSTPALVLAAAPYGEADRLYTLLTRDMGTLRARATSVRLERSKLRYALEPLSLAHVSIVSAKRGWRITTADTDRSLFFDIPDSKKRLLIFRIVSLIRRLAVGEMSDPELFDAVADGLQTLEHVPEEHIEGLEIVLVVRILEMLGYGIEDADRMLYEEHLGNSALLEAVLRDRKRYVRSINQALEMTGL